MWPTESAHCAAKLVLTDEGVDLVVLVRVRGDIARLHPDDGVQRQVNRFPRYIGTGPVIGVCSGAKREQEERKNRT